VPAWYWATVPQVEAASDIVVARPEPVVIRPPSRWTGVGARDLWRYRELLFFFAWRDLKVRYKQTFLGIVWAVLQPIMYMVVFTLFFGRIADLYSEGKPYALLALSGSVIWLFFANAVTLSAGSLVGNASLITKIYFPRLLAPVAPVIAGLVDLALSFGVLLVVMAAYGEYPDLGRVVFAVPFLVLAMGAAVGVGSWLAALNVKYRDVRYVVPFMLQLWLFASPVVYSSELLEGRLETIYYLNPMAGVVEGFRWALLGGVPPAYTSVVLSTVGGAALLVLGVLYFRRTERNFADIV
jgi:lipopolysaccharide transport system permease protein